MVHARNDVDLHVFVSLNAFFLLLLILLAHQIWHFFGLFRKCFLGKKQSFDFLNIFVVFKLHTSLHIFNHEKQRDLLSIFGGVQTARSNNGRTPFSPGARACLARGCSARAMRLRRRAVRAARQRGSARQRLQARRRLLRAGQAASMQRRPRARRPRLGPGRELRPAGLPAAGHAAEVRLGAGRGQPPELGGALSGPGWRAHAAGARSAAALPLPGRNLLRPGRRVQWLYAVCVALPRPYRQSAQQSVVDNLGRRRPPVQQRDGRQVQARPMPCGRPARRRAHARVGPYYANVRLGQRRAGLFLLGSGRHSAPQVDQPLR